MGQLPDEQHAQGGPGRHRECGGVVVLPLLGVGYLISDEKGMPVSTTFSGNSCWLTTRGIDVLDCRRSENGDDFFVRWKGRWWGVSRCREAAGVLSCRLPYPLRIDLRSREQPKVTAE